MGLVVDTNVFEHADNSNEIRHPASLALLNVLINTQGQLIYVDESLSPDESFILNEYIKRLVPGNFGHTVLLLLARQGRISPIKRTVNANITKKIKMWVHKPVDVTFVKVSFNSADRIFVSHDFEDLPQDAREFLYEKIAVNIVTASEFLPTTL
jgi:hypothetical protein